MTPDDLRHAVEAAARTLVEDPPTVRVRVANPAQVGAQRVLELHGAEAGWRNCEVLHPDEDLVLGVLTEADPDWEGDSTIGYFFQAAFGGELPEVVRVRPSSLEYHRLLASLEDPVIGSAGNWERIAAMLLGDADRVPRVPLGLPRYVEAKGVSPNPSQRRAIAMALSNAPLTVIEGPPGTGKTTVITEIIRCALQAGLRVACLSPTNLAVDNVIERLERDRHPFFPYRIGAGKKVGAEHFTRDNRLSTIREELRVNRLGAVAMRALPAGFTKDRHLAFFSRAPELEVLLGLITEAGHNAEVLSAALAERWPAHFASLLEERRLILASELIELQPNMQANLALAQRFGRIQEEDLDRLASLLEDAGAAPLFGTTVGFLAARELVKPVKGRLPFDILIVDEASKMTLPNFLLGALRARKIVLVGDSQQLPPFQNEREIRVLREAKVPAELNERSVFTHLERMGLPSQRVGLDIQYRMHPDLARFSNLVFYGGRIRNGKPGGLNYLEREKRITWLDQPGDAVRVGTSWLNDSHARLIANLLHDLQATAERRGKPIQVSILSFYGAQAEHLKRRLAPEAYPELQLTVGTVDSFQGKEGDVMIIDMVRASCQAPLRFINMAERVNVAFTRAKDYMFVIGDRATFQDPFYHVSALFHHPEVAVERRFGGR